MFIFGRKYFSTLLLFLFFSERTEWNKKIISSNTCFTKNIYMYKNTTHSLHKNALCVYSLLFLWFAFILIKFFFENKFNTIFFYQLCQTWQALKFLNNFFCSPVNHDLITDKLFACWLYCVIIVHRSHRQKHK